MKEDLKQVIISIFENDFSDYVSNKGILKYFENNIEKIVKNFIKSQENSKELIYKRVLKNSSEYVKISSIAMAIKSENLLKNRKELILFGNYLNLSFNPRLSYNQVLKKISKHIQQNRESYSNKYFMYRSSDEVYALEIENVKQELIKTYKDKTRNDMLNLSKIFKVKVDENDSAEVIRKKIITHIMKEKIKKL